MPGVKREANLGTAAFSSTDRRGPELATCAGTMVFERN